MYDMSRVNANGYFDAMDADARYELRKQLNEQRTADTKNGSYALREVCPIRYPTMRPNSLKDYYAYYKTQRGWPTSVRSTRMADGTRPRLYRSSICLYSYSDEIRSAVLIIHGEKAHSRYFSEDAFKKLKGDNTRELLIIPGANLRRFIRSDECHSPSIRLNGSL